MGCKRELRRPRGNSPGRLYPDTAAIAAWGSLPPWTESPPSLCSEPGPSARCWQLFPAVGCCPRASPPRPALPEREGRLTGGGLLHRGAGAGQWRSEGPQPVMAAAVSLPIEPCSPLSQAVALPLGAADFSSPPSSFPSRWFAPPFAAALGHGAACRKSPLPHRIPAAMLASCPKDAAGLFPCQPLAPALPCCHFAFPRLGHSAG